MLSGDIDTTYHTVQRDLFASGLAARIGVNAFGVWSAIKVHADFESGKAWPSVRKLGQMTGLGNATVMRAIQTLETEHLLRKATKGWPSNPAKGMKGRSHTYVARERLDVRLGNRVLCTIAVDYVPLLVHKKLAAIKDALLDPSKEGPDDLWSQVDIIPGPGFIWDSERKVLSAQVAAREVAALPRPAPEAGGGGLEDLPRLAEMLRKKPSKLPPKK